jgi:PAS domain S-box-containing protein
MKPKRNPRTKATPKRPLVSGEVLAPRNEGAAQRPMLAELRRRAEASLAARQEQEAPPAGPRTETDTARLLQVHQVELELQNAELREARDRMEDSLEQFADLYDFAPVGYFTLTSEGAIRQVNLAGARLLGLARSELVGRSFERLVTVEVRPAFQDFLKRVFAGLPRQTGDFELLGQGRPFRTVNIEAQCAASQRECRAVVVDITERQRVENQVRLSEVRYRRLFEAAHDGVLLLDPGTRKITDANPFMTQLLGYPNHELVGKELFEIGLLKDEGASQEMFRKLKRSHEVRYEDLPLESQTGRHQEVEVVANLYQENGHAVIQCNIRDITERKRAEEELRRNEALFSTLIEEAPYGVYVVNSNFRLQQVNRKARPVFRKVRPLIGRDFVAVHRLLWPRKVSDPIIARFRHTLKTGEPYQSPEFTARRRDVGVTEIYEWQIQRVTMPGGEYAVVAFFNDITQRKRAEEIQRRIEVLGASNRKLEQEIVRRQSVEKTLLKSERAQRRLLAESRLMQTQLRSFSHQILQAQEEERKRISRELHDDITQTLVNISVHLESLVGDANLDPRRLKRKIAHTQELVERSVDSIHQFARDLRPPALDHLGLISTLHALMTEFMKRTGVRVHFTTFAGVERLNSARRTVLYRVVQSALSNVARHAHAGRVDVTIRKLRDRVCMTIQDNGKSFDPARLRYRTRGQRLGLLGMRERLEMVGGRFELKAAPGQGTTITAQVPLGRAASAGGRALT